MVFRGLRPLKKGNAGRGLDLRPKSRRCAAVGHLRAKSRALRPGCAPKRRCGASPKCACGRRPRRGRLPAARTRFTCCFPRIVGAAFLTPPWPVCGKLLLCPFTCLPGRFVGAAWLRPVAVCPATTFLGLCTRYRVFVGEAYMPPGRGERSHGVCGRLPVCHGL